MSSNKKNAFVLYVLALIPMYLGGIVYAVMQQFMPYHSIAIGRDWSMLDTQLQVFILACLNGAGGLMVCIAIAITYLLLIPFKRHEPWSYLAIPVLGIATMLVGLRAAISITLYTPATPPWYGFILVIFLFAMGFIFSRR